MRTFEAQIELKLNETDNIQVTKKLLAIEQYVNEDVATAIYRKYKVAIRLHIKDEK